jgi:hypothetical protein
VKKALATILAFLYLATSADAAVTIHYCMGELYSVGLVKMDKCKKCGMKSGKGCCKDEIKIIKVQDKQQLAGKSASLPSAAAIDPLQPPINYSYFTRLQSQPTIHDNSPPVSLKVSLTILNSVFRI